MKQNDKTLLERVSMVSRATILARHALTDLCADYLRAIAIIHASELSIDQRETIEDIAQWFADTAEESQFAVSSLDDLFARNEK